MGILATLFTGSGGLGILSALLGSTTSIFYRKGIALWPHGRSSFMVIGNWIGSLFAIGIILFASAFWHTDMPWYVIPAFVALNLSIYHNGNRTMELNRSEKLSTLQIFGNIATILTIIAGFFLYGKTSLATLGIAVLCGFILFGSTCFDHGAFNPPKAWKKIVTTYTVGGLQSLAIVWIIGKTGSVGYYVISSLLSTAIAIATLAIKGQLGQVTMGTREFYMYRFADGFFFNLTRYIYFFLISSLGPVVTTLLGMLGNITTLIFGKWFLGEKNTMKEWGVNIVLCVLVGIGFYLK